MKLFKLLLSIALFILLAITIQKEPLWIDSVVYQYISTHLTNDIFTSFLKIITQLGSLKVILILDIICCFFIHNQHFSINMNISLLLSLISYKGLKKVFKRKRPEVIKLIKEKGYSFPSGHSCMSFTFYGYLLYYIYRHISNRFIKYALMSLLISIIILIGFSRIYLGVHYFSDVLAGYLLGAIILQIYIGGIKNENSKI